MSSTAVLMNRFFFSSPTPPTPSALLPLILCSGPLIAVGPMNQTLQAGEDLTLTCTGVNNDDASMPLAIFWLFAAANGVNSQTLLNSSDPRVTEMRLDDNVTVVSYFTVINVTANYTGNYTCVLSNRALGTPRAAMEMVTVTVFCKHMSRRVLPRMV